MGFRGNAYLISRHYKQMTLNKPFLKHLQSWSPQRCSFLSCVTIFFRQVESKCLSSASSYLLISVTSSAKITFFVPFMRFYFSLFVLLSIGVLVFAAPTDKKATARVNKEDVKLGDIYWPRLKHVEPRDPGYKVQCILARNK